jgi:hypothetical protein
LRREEKGAEWRKGERETKESKKKKEKEHENAWNVELQRSRR